MITLNRRSLSAIAKSVSGEMKHTEKLDAIAKALGYKDQTAIMAALKAAEATAPVTQSADPKTARERFNKNLSAMAFRRLREVRGTHLDTLGIDRWEFGKANGTTADQDYEAWREEQENRAAFVFCAEMNKALDAVATIRQDPLGKRDEILASLWAAITSIHHDPAAERPDVLNVEANRPLRTLFSLVSGMSGVHVDDESIMDAADRVISLLDPESETSPVLQPLKNFECLLDNISFYEFPEMKNPEIRDAYEDMLKTKELPIATDIDGMSPDAKNAVVAFVHSDDRKIEIAVDARHFLRDATAEEIKALLDCDCRGDYAADEIFVAAEVAGDASAKRLAAYLNSDVRMPNGDSMGFEVIAWTDEVTAWLEKNRPDVLAEARREPSPEVG